MVFLTTAGCELLAVHVCVWRVFVARYMLCRPTAVFSGLLRLFCTRTTPHPRPVIRNPTPSVRSKATTLSPLPWSAWSAPSEE